METKAVESKLKNKYSDFNFKNFKINNEKSLFVMILIVACLMLLMFVLNIIEYGKAMQWWAPFFDIVANIQTFLGQANEVYSNPIIQIVLPKLGVNEELLNALMGNLSTVDYILDTAVTLIKFGIFGFFFFKIAVYLVIFIETGLGFFNTIKDRNIKTYKHLNFAAFLAFIWGLTTIVLMPNEALICIALMLSGGLLMYFNDKVNYDLHKSWKIEHKKMKKTKKAEKRAEKRAH